MESDAAWRELMAAIGKRDSSLTKNIQSWLKDQGKYNGLIDGNFGPLTVKALQSFLKDKGLYPKSYLIDGKRGPATVKAEIAYLNLPANRGV